MFIHQLTDFESRGRIGCFSGPPLFDGYITMSYGREGNFTCLGRSTHAELEKV